MVSIDIFSIADSIDYSGWLSWSQCKDLHAIKFIFCQIGRFEFDQNQTDVNGNERHSELNEREKAIA